MDIFSSIYVYYIIGFELVNGSPSHTQFSGRPELLFWSTNNILITLKYRYLPNKSPLILEKFFNTLFRFILTKRHFFINIICTIQMINKNPLRMTSAMTKSNWEYEKKKKIVVKSFILSSKKLLCVISWLLLLWLLTAENLTFFRVFFFFFFGVVKCA